MPSNTTVLVDVHVSRAFYLVLGALRLAVGVANWLLPRLVRVKVAK